MQHPIRHACLDPMPSSMHADAPDRAELTSSRRVQVEARKEAARIYCQDSHNENTGCNQQARGQQGMALAACARGLIASRAVARAHSLFGSNAVAYTALLCQ
eukprot:364861-Chlamydomonas_euryale.AAC.18